MNQSSRIDVVARHQIVKGYRDLLQTVGQQGPPAYQAGGQFVDAHVVGPVGAPVALFKADSIRRDRDEATFGEVAGIGQIRVASQTDDLTLAQGRSCQRAGGDRTRPAADRTDPWVRRRRRARARRA